MVFVCVFGSDIYLIPRITQNLAALIHSAASEGTHSSQLCDVRRWICADVDTGRDPVPMRTGAQLPSARVVSSHRIVWPVYVARYGHLAAHLIHQQKANARMASTHCATAICRHTH